MSTEVTLVGRIGGKDPELRFTPGGKAVCSFDMATSRRVQDQDTKEWKDLDTTWYRVSCWETMAENVAEALRSGYAVIVKGRLAVREYEREDGSKGKALDVQAYAIGPDLRWMNAKVSKPARTNNDAWADQNKPAPPPPAPADDPWAVPGATAGTSGLEAPF